MKAPGPVSASRDGFALVVTITLMVLLTMLAAGMLSLAAISLRGSGRDAAMAEARANARMALTLALGELQAGMGPDQRISARADVLDEELPNPVWTGGWRTDANPSPVWLVSGLEADPYRSLDDSDSVKFHRPAPGTPGEREVRAPLLGVAGATAPGNIAWWVADEGVKARVDLDPSGPQASEAERMAASRSPLAPSIHPLGGAFSQELFGADGAVNRRLLASLGTVGLAIDDRDVPRRHFHDLTIGGYGLPVDVRRGGFKTDLSLVFDRAEQGKPFVAATLGATPGPVVSTHGSSFHQFNSISSPAAFFLSDRIAANRVGGVGPNWGILFNYARLWTNVSAAQSIGLIHALPRVETNLRQQHWLPYDREVSPVQWARDLQHRNGPVAPVVSVLQIGFYLGASPVAPHADGTPRFRAQIYVKPVIGFWNPYNVTIRPATYILEWSACPFIEVRYGRPGADGSLGGGTATPHWLREYWRIGTYLPTDQGVGGRYMQLRTDPIDFQPGEFRLFSVEGNPGVSSSGNRVVPTLDPNGAFSVDLNHNGQPLLIDSGDRVWCENLVLQDFHWPATSTKFPGLDFNGASTWITVKSGSVVLSRYTNLWNGGIGASSAAPLTPEPITPLMPSEPAGGKQTHLIDDLGGGELAHIGTWRWQIRNSTESDEPGQGLRGWVDSNPTVLVSNMCWDGSTNNAEGVQGWNAISHMVPSTHRLAGVGDGHGGNRGLVAEGAQGSQFPQGVPAPDRWQGFGGQGSTAASGYPRAIIHDIPRAPLVSLGQFQHAHLSRYNFEPGFVVGNSYANPRIPLDSIVHPNFADQGPQMPGFDLVDISHQINERLWDRYFFSTLGRDYLGIAGGMLDDAFGYEALVRGERRLPNPRNVFLPLAGDDSIDRIVAESGVNAPSAIAARIATSGAFNVNSTSVEAWMEVLASMDFSELPTIDPLTGAVSWRDPGGIRFSRFGHPITATPTDGAAKEAAFWQGWREIGASELRQLAEAIVTEVRARGPFLSFADFVNRNPDSSDVKHQRKGALQAALDTALNNNLPAEVARAAENPVGARFSEAIAGENQAGGHASYLLQGDLLQSLAPVMQVRSDSFRIRGYGETRDPSGRVIARVWCEALVQRTASYMDPADRPETLPSGLVSELNRTYGRRFEVVGFRWLAPEEL